MRHTLSVFIILALATVAHADQAAQKIQEASGAITFASTSRQSAITTAIGQVDQLTDLVDAIAALPPALGLTATAKANQALDQINFAIDDTSAANTFITAAEAKHGQAVTWYEMNQAAQAIARANESIGFSGEAMDGVEAANNHITAAQYLIDEIVAIVGPGGAGP